MNMLIGTITEIYISEGTAMADVRVGNSRISVPLYLLMKARIGDEIVIDSGVAISHLDDEELEEEENVSRGTGQGRRD